MAMVNRILDLGSQGELASGLFPSAGDEQAPFWLTGANVQFREGGVGKIPGWTSFLTELGAQPVRGLLQQRRIDLSQHLYWGDLANLYWWDAITVRNVGGGFSGVQDSSINQLATFWSMLQWGDWVLATNGQEGIYIFKKDLTSNEFLPLSSLTTLPFTQAEFLIKRGPHALALGLDTDFNGYKWSSADDVELWTPANDNSAGGNVIRELDSPIRAVVMAGQRIVVYSEESQHHISYTGAPFYFGHIPGLQGIGATGKNSVIPVGQEHYGLGRMGPWWTDFARYRLLGENEVREYLDGRINWSQAAKINGWHDKEFERVVWYYPVVGGSGEPEEGIAYNYLRQHWEIFSFGRTAALPRVVYDNPIAGASDGSVLFHHVGTSADGAAINPSIRTRPINLNPKGGQYPGETLLKLIWALSAGFQKFDGATVECRIGTQEFLDDAISWGSWFALDPGKGRTLPPEEMVGAWVSFEFRSTETTGNWIMDTLNIFGWTIGQVFV